MISNGTLTDPEVRRFSKQMLLPQIRKEGQEKFKGASVAVIGIGGIGSTVLQYLAASGVGYLGIIDFTMVDEKNIQQQTLYGGSDLGKLKSIISKQHLENLFPLVDFEIINLQLTPQNIQRIISPYDIIVDATNQLESHRVIGDACRELKLPLIYGSVNEFSGEVAAMDVANAEIYGKYLAEKLESSEEAINGTSVLTYGMVGNLMAMEVLKEILNDDNNLKGKVLILDVFTYQFLIKDL